MAGLSICKVEHNLCGSEKDCAVIQNHIVARDIAGRRWSDQESGWLFGHQTFVQRVSLEPCFPRQHLNLSQEPVQELRSLKWANRKLSGQIEGLDASLCQQVQCQILPDGLPQPPANMASADYETS